MTAHPHGDHRDGHQHPHAPAPDPVPLHGHDHDGRHEHENHHQHEHQDHDHSEESHHHGTGLWGRVRGVVVPHSHDAGDAVDTELEASTLGTRTLISSFAILGATAVIQLVVVALSSSVALFGDSLHNLADSLTVVPLAVAFTLGRRPPNRRFTYGYGRAEDLAGVAVVVLMAGSSALAAYEAIDRLVHPHLMSRPGLVAAAALVGCAGNELVAHNRIRVGRRIGSAALVADGLHARTDGLTSLAVLLGAGGSALGARWADPVVGLVITVAILAVLRAAVRQVFARLMDAVDPALLTRVEEVIRATDGVLAVGQVRLRWIGHSLRAECDVAVDPHLGLVAAHRIADETEHRLLHQVRRLSAATVHADPLDPDPAVHHQGSAHHRAPAAPPPR
jgi:cation diffusion facilitator family transporter